MIIDLARFVREERPFWDELEAAVNRLESDPGHRMDMAALRRFHYLYQRASADLARLGTFSHEPETRRYLESLVARAYGEVHEVRGRPHRLALLSWFTVEFPRAFRRQIRAFYLSLLVSLLGCIFGAGVLAGDYETKRILFPPQFGHLYGRPSDRVAMEEAPAAGRSEHRMHGSFAAHLMQNNISVSIRALALGLTYGVGTIILLFYNGVIVGGVAYDYIADGQLRFLLGWLLPHGSIELPAVFIAGQAGLVLASAILGWGDKHPLRARLRSISSDLVFLIYGVAVMLVWAGIVESFLSQYHEPVLPYGVKIGFGLLELGLLAWFLARSGRGEKGTSARSDAGRRKAPVA